MRANLLRNFLLALFGLVLLSALTYVNLGFTRANPGGNDFLPRWLGARLFITQGQNPYSAETTAAIQQAMYGRPAQEGEDQALFAYPLYALILFAPFALINDYELARALWITTLEIAVALTVIGAVRLGGWKPGRLSLALFLVFSLAWFHTTKPLVDGNASILVALFVTLGLLALKRGQGGLAGLLFAFSTIKPQIVAPLIVFVAIWTISKKKPFLIPLIVSLGILAGVSFILQPDWLVESVAQAMIYPTYSPPGTVAGIFSEWWGELGSTIGSAVLVIFGLLLLYEWWVSIGEEFDRFFWGASLTLVLAPFVGVPSTTSNYVVFLPILPFVFGLLQNRLGKPIPTFVGLDLGLLFFAPWVLFLTTLQQTAQFRESLILFFPAPVILLANLYWQRWWVKRPPTQPVLQGREV